MPTPHLNNSPEQKQQGNAPGTPVKQAAPAPPAGASDKAQRPSNASTALLASMDDVFGGAEGEDAPKARLHEPEEAPEAQAAPKQPAKAAPQDDAPEAPSAPKPDASDDADPFALPEAKKPETKKEEAKKEGDDTAPAKPEEFKKVGQLRTAYETVKKELAALRAEHEKIKSAPKDDTLAKAAAKERDELKAKYDEAQEFIRLHKYEASNEYREKFSAPIERAFEKAHARITELTVQTPEGERPATPQDFNQIVGMPWQKALKASKEMFGDAAEAVMRLRDGIHDLDRDRKAAIEDYRKNGAERMKTEEAARQANLNRLQKAMDDEIASVAERTPELFKPVDDDKEGNEWLAMGRKFADLIFNNPDPSLTEAQIIKNQAQAYQRLAAVPRLIYQNQQAKAKIAELEAALKEYEDSKPGPGDEGKGPKGKSKEVNSLSDAFAAIDSMG